MNAPSFTAAQVVALLFLVCGGLLTVGVALLVSAHRQGRRRGYAQGHEKGWRAGRRHALEHEIRALDWLADTNSVRAHSKSEGRAG
jgi:hypothetical protein